MAICGWVVASGSSDSKFGIGKAASCSGGSKFDIRKGASGRWHRVVVAACLASGWWHRGVCIGKKMGWGLGLFFVVFIFKCVIFILLCLNF